MKPTNFLLLTLLQMILCGQVVFAQNQNDESGKDVGLEIGGHVGKILPNQIDGMDEIMGLGGLRAGYRIGEIGFLEGGIVSGKGYGAEYSNAQFSFRMDVPIENIVGTIFLGPDITFYKGQGYNSKIFGGGHVGGGILTHLGGSLWIRSDMKFTINPGTSLYVSFGFLFRFSGK